MSVIYVENNALRYFTHKDTECWKSTPNPHLEKGREDKFGDERSGGY